MNKMEEMLETLTDEQKAVLAEMLGVKTSGANCTYKVRELVELSFNEKPSREMREKLSEAGFHWNSFEKVWFAYKSEAVMSFVEKHGIAKA